MTTAPENRGGMRPTAPQNNPANVSGVGGAGQSGNYTGFAYGQNQAVNQQRVQGNQAVATTKAAMPSPSEPYAGMNFPELGTLFDPDTNPMEPMTTGVDFGRGAGSEALPKNLVNNTRIQENAAIAKQYLPDLVIAAQSVDAPDSFKRFVNYLMAQ
jgi:hypothetical protein